MIAARIETAPDAAGQVVTIRPAPLPAAWAGAVLLLAALFGLPALAILLSPARWDALSLASMAIGLGIAGWATLALLRARRARRPQRLMLDRSALAANGAVLRWDAVAGFEAVAPPVPQQGLAQRPGAAGGIAMGQRIGAARAAQEWRVVALLADGGRRPLAQGLDQAAAARLCAVLEAARRDPPGGS